MSMCLKSGPFRLIITVLIIGGVLTAGISPACQFISGQSVKPGFIQICTAFGIKTVPAPDGFEDSDNKNPGDINPGDGKDNGNNIADECPFCLSSKINMAAGDASTAITVSISTWSVSFALPLSMGILRGKAPAYFQARAPPFFS